MTHSISALNQIFNARSVAVVGASNNPEKFGYALLDTMRRSGYTGTIFPINHKATEIQGLRAYPTLNAVPGNIELAVILVPARFVAGVIREAGEKGIAAAAILSAGFREAGRQDLEDELAQVAAECHVRLLGPNIQGFSYLPNKLCAMFWPVMKSPGPLSIIGQSGSVTAAVAEWAAEDGLGISAAINLGNQTDLDACDVLEFLAQDSATQAIALHLESIKDGRRFLKVAKRTAKKKPVVVLKSGRSEAGKRSAASHTGALAGRDEIFDAACRQTGLIRANDLEQLYDFTKALTTIHPQVGNRLSLLTTSGGGATLAVDEAEKLGLCLPALPQTTLEELALLELPAKMGNPLDMPVLSAHAFARCIEVIDRAGLTDAYLLCLGDPVPGSTDVLAELKTQIGDRLAVAFFGGGEIERKSRFSLNQAGIPVFPSPERATRAIAAAVRYASLRHKAGTENGNSRTEVSE